MRQRYEPRSRAHTSPSQTRRLALENARLRRLCAASEALVTRHDMLLREGDHRIKNSLQIVASLLGMQERRATSGDARDALRTAIVRIRAVARIHDELQLRGAKDIVDLGALISTMCQSLQELAGDASSIKISAQVDAIETPLSFAQPLVLAVNELIVNALLHAFPDNRSGNVHVALSRHEGELRIRIADDGAGFAEKHDNDGRGYGMKLVRSMIAEVGGGLQMESGAGSRFTLSVPAAFLKAAVNAPRPPAANHQVHLVCEPAI